MLRDGSEVEYEAFLAEDVADGLEEEWKRPMHWAGFLVVGAATRLPRHTPSQPAVVEGEAGAQKEEDGQTWGIKEWLVSISLQGYTDSSGSIDRGCGRSSSILHDTCNTCI